MRRLVQAEGRDLFDRILGLIARVAMHGWFRNIEVVGTEGVPRVGPIVVVANHGNGFVDPSLLVATFPRPLRFLAKATLWRLAPVGWLLDTSGALPVGGAGRGTQEANRRTFRSCHDELRRGGAVALFPEGTTHDELRVRPLHTGAARIALGARAVGARGLSLVPVGLLYEHKAAPRSRVLVNVGTAIDLDAAVERILVPGEVPDEDSRVAVAQLTNEISDALRGASLELPDSEEAPALFLAARIYLAEGPTEGHEDVPLSSLEPLVRRLSLAPAELRKVVVESLAYYRLHLDLFGLDDDQVLAGVPGQRLRAQPGLGLAVAILLTPIAGIGVAINLVPWLVVDWLSGRPMARVSRANFTLLTSLAAYPLAWTAVGLFMRRLKVRHPWALAFGAGPIGGQAAVGWWERIRDLRRARLGWRQVLRNAEALDALRQRRASVIHAVSLALSDSAASPDVENAFRSD